MPSEHDISGSWDLSSGPPRNQKLTEDDILALQVLRFLPLANETHIICRLFSPTFYGLQTVKHKGP